MPTWIGIDTDKIEMWDRFKLRLVSAAVLLGLALGAQGCSAVIESNDLEPTDLTPIKIGAARNAVENVLGNPNKRELQNGIKVAWYRFNLPHTERPRPPPRPRTGLNAPDLSALIYGLPIFVLLSPYLMHKAYEKQRGDITVFYTPNDTVSWLDFGKMSKSEALFYARSISIVQYGGSETQYDSDLAKCCLNEQKQVLRTAYWKWSAERGDREAQFKLSGVAGMPAKDALIWLCRSADQGYGMAQIELGRLNWYGMEPFEENKVQGFVWYRLAAFGGSRRGQIEVRERRPLLTSSEVARAETILRNWKKGDCQRLLPIEKPRTSNRPVSDRATVGVAKGW